MDTIQIRIQKFPKDLQDDLRQLRHIMSARQRRYITLEEMIVFAVERGVGALKEELSHGVGGELIEV